MERPDAALATDLPDLEEVACADIPVIEHVPAGCLSLVETEYRRLLANVILCNRGDAWQETDENSPTYDADIEEKKARARVAWQEWWMFPKCCLGTPLKGGQRRKRKTEALLRSRLERWHHGERVELWADAEERESTGGAKPQGAVDVEKQQKLKRARARHYAAHGMPAKAVQRLTTAGMAPDTAETEKAMRSKFPEPPVGGQGVDLPAAPPANELSVEEVRGAICAFARGAAAGPSGLRPDLLRQLIERGDSRSSLRVMTAFANMLADGKAPDRLAPWVAGAAGHAFRKRHKPGAPEEAVGVRPVCCGEAWRRLVSKALLGTEREAAVRYLQPYQLAVGVSAGVEAVPHVARAWKRKYENDPERVCLDFDESNAYNCVSRVAFLERMQVVFPGLSRWLRWIYPVEGSTWVLWQGRQIESKTGGHQGCPLMSLCHAAVQRCIPEALGLTEVWAGTRPLIPAMDPPPALDFIAMFADDGLIGGKQVEIVRVAHHLRTYMPATGLTFGKMAAIPACPRAHSIDTEALREAGCSWEAEGNFEAMRAPIGSDVWAREYTRSRAEDTLEVYAELARLGDPHSAFYLARYQAGRTNYIWRTAPATQCIEALAAVDSCVQALVQGWLGTGTLTADAFEQATLPQRLGGLGLPNNTRIADAAYVASRCRTRELVSALWTAQSADSSDGEIADLDLDAALARFEAKCAPAVNQGVDDMTDTVEEEGWKSERTQKALSSQVAQHSFEQLWRRQSAHGRANIQAHCGMGSGAWLQPAPSVDTSLSEAQFATAVAYRLGVDQETAGLRPCRFCGAVRDVQGRHDQSCTAGGDVTERHNQLRDQIYDLARRAHTNPRLEQPGLLSEPGGVFLDLRRPADVLVHMAREGTMGSAAGGSIERIAIDVKVINACGRRHCATGAAPDADLALRRYAEQAYRHQQTGARCAAQGVVYTPMVFSAQGGMSKAADGIVIRLAQLIEVAEGTPKAETRRSFIQTMSRLLVQQGARAHARRRGRPGVARWSSRTGVEPDLRRAAGREHGDDHWWRDDESTAFGSDGDVAEAAAEEDSGDSAADMQTEDDPASEGSGGR